jgi:hypothetical protein
MPPFSYSKPSFVVSSQLMRLKGNRSFTRVSSSTNLLSSRTDDEITSAMSGRHDDENNNTNTNTSHHKAFVTFASRFFFILESHFETVHNIRVRIHGIILNPPISLANIIGGTYKK